MLSSTPYGQWRPCLGPKTLQAPQYLLGPIDTKEQDAKRNDREAFSKADDELVERPQILKVLINLHL